MELLNRIQKDIEKILENSQAQANAIKQLQTKIDRPQAQGDNATEIKAISNLVFNLNKSTNHMNDEVCKIVNQQIKYQQSLSEKSDRELKFLSNMIILSVVVTFGFSISIFYQTFSNANQKERLQYLENQVGKLRELNPKITEKYFGK